MGKLINEVGNIYSELTVIEKVKKANIKDQTSAYWLCRCICGKFSQVKGFNLRTGRIKSCGSCNKKGKPLYSKRVELATEKALYQAYKSRAKKKETSFSLVFDDALSLFKSDCSYCGAPPSSVRKDRSVVSNDREFIYNGIDRVDSKKGYELNNVVSCCYICNRAKSDMDYSNFKQWVRAIYAYSVAEDWSEK